MKPIRLRYIVIGVIAAWFLALWFIGFASTWINDMQLEYDQVREGFALFYNDYLLLGGNQLTTAFNPLWARLFLNGLAAVVLIILLLILRKIVENVILGYALPNKLQKAFSLLNWSLFLLLVSSAFLSPRRVCVVDGEKQTLTVKLKEEVWGGVFRVPYMYESYEYSFADFDLITHEIDSAFAEGEWDYYIEIYAHSGEQRILMCATPYHVGGLAELVSDSYEEQKLRALEVVVPFVDFLNELIVQDPKKKNMDEGKGVLAQLE